MKKSFLGLVVAFTVAFGNLAVAGEGKHWSYVGEEGPEHWGELSDEFKVCGEGKNQSPVNIENSVKAGIKPITFNYKSGSSEIVNNGHTIQVNMAEGSSITLDGKSFTLKQFHFHTPSENQINGKSFPLEAHFVHADSDGNLAVVAVMFEEGAPNKTIDEIWEKMPKNAGEKAAFSMKADEIAKLLPKNKSYYRFSGSLTTPPCTEGVRWLVLKSSIKISKQEVEEFLHVMHHNNNRPIQKLNGRVIVN